MPKSAKEYRNFQIEAGVMKIEEIDDLVAKGIAAKTLTDDLAESALPEHLFAKALTAIDKVIKPGEMAIAKSETAAFAAKVDAALGSADEPSTRHVVDIVKSQNAVMAQRVTGVENLVRDTLGAFREMFTAFAEGLNGIAKQNNEASSLIASEVREFAKSQVVPKTSAPAAAVAGAGSTTAAPVTADTKPTPSVQERVVKARNKVMSILKSETEKPGCTVERRNALAMYSSQMAGNFDLNAISYIAQQLGAQLD